MNTMKEDRTVRYLLGGYDSCDCCNRSFILGDVVRRSGKKAYCDFCDEDIQETDLRYLVTESGTRLILDKASLPNISLGVYTVGKQDGFGVVNSRLEENEYTLQEFIELHNDTYVLEADNWIKGGVFVLYLPADRLENKYDFWEHRDGYQDIIDDFAAVAGKNLYYVLDETDSVTGFVTSRLWRREATERYISEKTGGKIMSRRELEAEYNREILGKEELTPKQLTPAKLLACCEQRIQGQGRELKKAVFMVYKYMQKVLDGTIRQADNWLLTAPSGSGKTEFFRCIRDVFKLYNVPIPVVQIDLSQITQTGFKGANADSISKRIMAEDMSKFGECICFLDEADKKCKPVFDSNSVNVNASIQGCLLALLEGIKQEKFDSNKTMFVLMGAFQDARNNKRDKENSQPQIGFMSEQSENKAATVDDATDVFYDKLDIQDIIDYGMQEELAGRIMQVVNFKKLSKKDMRNLIISKAKSISEELDMDIHLTNAAVEDFLAIAYGSLGVRRPMNVIKELAINTASNVFFEDGFDSSCDRIIISGTDKACVKKGRRKEAARRIHENPDEEMGEKTDEMAAEAVC